MISIVSVNWLAVIGAAIVSMIFGGIWFSPAVFGKMWMKELGIKEKDMQKAMKSAMAKGYAVTFIGAIVMSFVLALVLKSPQPTVGIISALSTGFLLWLGFSAVVLLPDVLWGEKSMKFFWLIAIEQLIGILIMAAILVTYA